MSRSSRKYGWKVDSNDFNNPAVVSGIGAFGDLVTAELCPRVQNDFVYGGNALLFDEMLSGTGAITYGSGMAKCRSHGTGAARLTTKRVNKYRSGQGALFRFTAMYSPPAIGGEQIIGAFSCSTNALVVGYDKETVTVPEFGFLRRHSGLTEVQALQITTPAAGAETLIITLDGTGYSVGVTAGTAEETAQEIAEGTFSGWTAEATGDEVHFLSHTAGVRGGAYAISNGGGATDGTYTQEVVGAPPVNDWAYQSDWNIDRMDGTGPSGQVLDTGKLNVFAISLQYLGAGGITLFVEDSHSARFVPVHTVRYANENIIPSVTNPTFHLGLCASGTADVWCETASMAGFIEGIPVQLGPIHAIEYDGVVSAETPVISIRCGDIYHSGGSRTNLRDIILGLFSMTATGSNKPIKGKIVRNGTLADPLWSAFDASNSIAHYDISATGITGGDVLVAAGVGASTPPISLTQEDIPVVPGDIISLVCEPAGTAADVVASIGWREDL